MKRFLFLVTLILAVCLVAGCGGGVKAYSDPEETIGISPDKEFIILIALESNPTTGYSWEASYDETMLELVEETYELGEYAQQGIVGAGGTELFRFRALNSGEVEIVKIAWEVADERGYAIYEDYEEYLWQRVLEGGLKLANWDIPKIKIEIRGTLLEDEWIPSPGHPETRFYPPSTDLDQTNQLK